MNAPEIRELQRRVGVADDGVFGPATCSAVRAHLRALMPVPHPWPDTDAQSLRAFYGEPGDEAQIVKCNVSDIGLKYEGQHVSAVRCHSRVAASLRRVLEEIAAGPHAPLLTRWGGCFNFRRQRGGSSWSLHAFGAAVDIDPDNNGNRARWPQDASMPLAVMEAFAREGWLSAGAFWLRDAMHFQATK